MQRKRDALPGFLESVKGTGDAHQVSAILKPGGSGVKLEMRELSSLPPKPFVLKTDKKRSVKKASPKEIVSSDDAASDVESVESEPELLSDEDVEANKSDTPWWGCHICQMLFVAGFGYM